MLWPGVGIADSNVHLKELPYEAVKLARAVVAECKESGDGTGGNLDRTVDVYQTGDGKRLALFDPKRIYSFKGNGVCSTDGCEVRAYSEQLPGFWTIALQQTIIGDAAVEAGRGSKPLQMVVNFRGGTPACDRDRAETCIFELTWRGAGFAWKRLR